MSWPTPQGYQEALQSPRLAFSDPELAASQPDTDQLGLPRPISGNFASVYRVRSGGRSWAVRCFLREFGDQRERYACISEHLSSSRLRYTVDFTYLNEGVRVAGRWYPILKMEWLQGELLSTHVRHALADPPRLAALAERWRVMILTLEQAGITHGDLQHGNVLVCDGDLRLIDYDGMFVPALAGMQSHELGHRNYQHPRRDERHFGPELDRFSAWVIYLSLRALAADPSLWRRFGGGDETLLLRREDFQEPERSRLLAELARCSDAHVRHLAQMFEHLPALDPAGLPSLAELLPDLPVSSPGPIVLASQPIPELEPEEDEEPLPVERPQVLPRIDFGRAVWIDRVAFTAALVALAGLVASHGAAFEPSVASLVFVLGWLGLFTGYRYHGEPAVERRFEIRERLAALQCDLAPLRAEIQRRRGSLAQKRARLKRAHLEFEVMRQALERAAASELEALQAPVRDLRCKRLALATAETGSLARLRQDVAFRLVDIPKRIGALPSREREEIESARRARQQAHLRAGRELLLLDSRQPPAAPATLAERLAVQGAPAAPAAERSDWRQGLLTRVAGSTPVLSEDEIAAIRARTIRRREQLERELEGLPAFLAAQERSILARYQAEREELAGQEWEAQARAARDVPLIRARYERELEQLRASAERAAAQARIDVEAMEARLRAPRADLLRLEGERLRLLAELEALEAMSYPRFVARIVGA